MIDLIKLHALADGELSEQEAKFLREQVLTSEEAGRELSAIYNLKDCVRSKAQIFTCEVTFTASMKRVAELDRNRRVNNFVTRYAWGIAGAFVVLIALGGVRNRTTASHRVETADIASVFARLLPSSAPQSTVPSKDRARVNQWLQNLIQNARGVADLDGHQVKVVPLADQFGSMALIVIQGDVSLDGMSELASGSGYFSCKIQGHNGVARKEEGRLLVLIGDRPNDSLLDMLRHMKVADQ